MAVVVRNRFYFSVALVLAVLVAGGFMRTFYARPLFDLPPLPTLLQLHGVVFTAWFVLFVIQTRLIAAQKYRTHMQLGIAGVVVAALVVILGLFTIVMSASAPRVRPMGMSSPQFVLVPLVAIIFFAVLVTAAVALRRHAQLHKRLMTLAMLTVIGPPLARLIAVTKNGEDFLAIQMGVPAAFIAWCLVSDWMKFRIVHPVYAFGGAALIVSWPLRVIIAQTPAWERVGNWMASL